MKKTDIFETIEQNMKNVNLDETTKTKILKNVQKLKNEKINLMIIGTAGSGKSSTINAIFDMEVAKVATGTKPETMDIKKYELDNLIIWDTPGFGESKEKDIAIIDKLNEYDEKGEFLIDFVLVVLDGSSKNMGKTYKLFNEIILPNFYEDRILITINKADIAMDAKGWNYEKNQPTKELKLFLDEKVKFLKRKLKEVIREEEIIYYSAGYKDKKGFQKPWNLSGLLYFIIKNIPNKKRNTPFWLFDDSVIVCDGPRKIKKSFMEIVVEYISKGEEKGKIFGTTGEKIGKVVGVIVGVSIAIARSILDWFKALF